MWILKFREYKRIIQMIKLSQYSSGLTERDGILFAKKESVISYPSDGNEACYQLEEDSFWFNHRNNCIVAAVKKYSPNKDFFDIGGGNGYVAQALEEEGIQTVLIEPGIQGCVNARKRRINHIVCSTLENAEFKKDSIPAVGLFDVVEHIEDDLSFLQSIQSFLQQEGKVFITVPAFNSLWSNEDDDAGHYRRYTTKNMEQRLESVGFKIVYSTYIFSILPLPVFLFRTLPSKLKISRNSGDWNKHKDEHKRRGGIVDSMLNQVWNYELNRIKKGKRVPVGGSCFVVAEKL